MKICAIHQPNFFPWLGYFDKLRRADVFVFLDDVAYPKSGSGSGTWINRVKIAINDAPAWVGSPICRESGVQIIKDVKIDDSQPWRKKLLKTLEMNYRRTRNYDAVISVLKPLISQDTNNLAKFNIEVIKTLCGILNISTDFILQSDLGSTGKATELLINITKAVGANAYLCGGGAGGYQEDHRFEENNIELIYQNFTSPIYCEESKFVAGLSVIDYLMKSKNINF